MLTEIYSHYLRIHKGREDSGDEISIAIHTYSSRVTDPFPSRLPTLYCKIKVTNL